MPSPKQPSSRQIKLRPHFSPRAYNRYKIVPELRMSGRWLQKAGFAIGSHVDIEISENQLIIKKRS